MIKREKYIAITLKHKAAISAITIIYSVLISRAYAGSFFVPVFWYSLISSFGAFFIIHNFISGKTINLSVYSLVPKKNPAHELGRYFVLLVFLFILVYLTSNALGVNWPKYT